MSALKFSIEKKDGEYHYTYEHGPYGFNGVVSEHCIYIDEVLETIKEIVEESEDV